MIESLLRDLRFAVRSLAKSPGFVAAAVGSLGLALALATTTFAVLDSLRHPYTPVKDPDRVFYVRMWGDLKRATGFQRYEVLRDWGRFYRDVALIAASRGDRVQVSDSLELLFSFQVTANYFDLLGVRPVVGRAFGPADDDVAIISHELWRRSLGGRPLDALTVEVGGRTHAVVGVMPPGLGSPDGEVWLHLPPSIAQSGAGVAWVSPVVRLKDGLSIDQVKAELAVLAQRLTDRYGAGPDPFGYSLRSVVREPMPFRPIHVAMASAALGVLLIACANLASLMLVRGAVKRRELAVRLALGAGRGALIQQLVAEAALIAVAGGVVGMLLTAWATAVLGAHLPPYVRGLGSVTPYVSWRVFVFAFAATASSAVLFGVLPAWRASDVKLVDPLKDSGATTGKVRYRYNPLVVGEIAVSLVLLMAVALLSRAAVRVSGLDFGYRHENLLGSYFRLSRELDSTSLRAAVQRVVEHVRDLDGVTSVAARASVFPINYTVLSDAYDGEAGALFLNAVSVVSPGFLRTLGVPIVRGRDFLEGDGVAGAAIVDEAAARVLWGGDGADAVGRTLKLGDLESPAPWIRVVGVARGARLRSGFDPYLAPPPAIYVVNDRIVERLIDVAVRVNRSEAVMAVRIRRQIEAALPPGSHGGWTWRWVEGYENLVRARKFLAGVFGMFSAFALVLAAIGLYGVLAYAVSQRLREFAIRLALGAESGRILRMVLHDGAVIVLAGTGIGAFLAMWSAQILDEWLYGVFFTDAVSLITAEVVLLIAGFAACIGPAFRATRADPVTILRAT